MTLKRPLISVVTVCYQAEEFLEQCIQSVVEQDFTDFEYIVIDGGSSDGTVKIIKKYQDKLAYWHSKPDRGLSHAFNLGIEKSKGEWLAFLNSDDRYVSPRALSQCADTLRKENNADVIYGRIQHIKRQADPVPQSDEIGGRWCWRDYKRYSTIPHPAAFLNRRLIGQIGWFDENFRNALDYELFLRKGPALATHYIPELIAQMRIGGISTEGVERSLRESRDAQIKNGANSVALAYFWWWYFSARAFIKRMIPWLTR